MIGAYMMVKVRLDEVLSPHLLKKHHEHIGDFLLQEGIAPDPADLGATMLTERKVKELLAELADDLQE